MPAIAIQNEKIFPISFIWGEVILEDKKDQKTSSLFLSNTYLNRHRLVETCLSAMLNGEAIPFRDALLAAAKIDGDKDGFNTVTQLFCQEVYYNPIIETGNLWLFN